MTKHNVMVDMLCWDISLCVVYVCVVCICVVCGVCVRVCD